MFSIVKVDPIAMINDPLPLFKVISERSSTRLVTDCRLLLFLSFEVCVSLLRRGSVAFLWDIDNLEFSRVAIVDYVPNKLRKTELVIVDSFSHSFNFTYPNWFD
jgi:hypothetical protein